MELQEIIDKLRSYPAFDIEANGVVVQKQLYTDNTDIKEVVMCAADNFSRIRLVPKNRVGNAFMRDTANSMSYQKKTVPEHQEAPADVSMQLPVGNNSSDFYRILWEQERANAREYKEKYERVYEDLHRKELELVENKNSIGASMISGLGSIAPMFMGGGGGVGELPAQSHPQPQTTPGSKPIDKKMGQVVTCYMKQTEDVKKKLAKLFSNIFSQIELLDDFIDLTNKNDEMQY